MKGKFQAGAKEGKEGRTAITTKKPLLLILMEALREVFLLIFHRGL